MTAASPWVHPTRDVFEVVKAALSPEPVVRESAVIFPANDRYVPTEFQTDAPLGAVLVDVVDRRDVALPPRRVRITIQEVKR